MVIFIKWEKVKRSLFLILLLILLGGGVQLYRGYRAYRDVYITKPWDHALETEIRQIFENRNNAILKEDMKILDSLYDKEARNGLLAYEHELKKMKYLHQWSHKQSITFTKVDSKVVINNIQEKGEGYSVNLAVSTEYQYAYNHATKSTNSFRMGTYHTLDLSPDEEGWLITKEWYTDPFADSLDLNEVNTNGIKEVILSGGEDKSMELEDGRLGAVDYADKYCGVARPPEYSFKYNTEYKNYKSLGGDCTNFASQVLYEGGKFSKNSTWNYNKGQGSKAWVNAHAFNNYMLHGGRGSSIAHGTYEQVLKDSYKLLPGDYIAYEKKGRITHISVVTGMDSEGYILVNSYNTDRYRVPWDLGWSNKGIKFWLVRVHY